MLSFSRSGRLPVVRQAEAAECGLACIAMVASFYGHRIDLGSLRRRYPVSLSGTTLRGLITITANLKLIGRPVRFDLAQIDRLRMPAIVHWDMNHFAVLKAVNKREITVHDPALGARKMPLSEASKHITGVALELTPAPDFQRIDERARLPFSTFWSSLAGSGHALLQVMLLSVILQVLLLAAPFYMQITLDDVIARGDVDLLAVLALGFGLLAVIRVVATTIRSSVLLIIQNALAFQIGARLFHHLIRLPAAYFEKRHIGDILSRFGSLQPIRTLLAEGLITALIDGVMALFTLAMIIFYSPILAAIVMAAVVIYGIIRVTLYRIVWSRTDETIQANAQENSTFIESVRAIQSLKLFNREADREGMWLNRYADVANANVRLGRAKIAFSTVNDALFSLETILIIYFAARLALANEITVGMIFAFIAYKQLFTERAAALIEKTLDFRLLGLHLERLSDIALTPLEAGHDMPLSYSAALRGQIEVRNVCFRYSDTDPLVLDNINLTIEPGEFVTIMGPSGGGKTTLIKIMLGLLEPTSGEVLIDGERLSMMGVRRYREQVAAVMQDDQLLSGSIADNICFFDQEFAQEKVVNSAQLAGIHDEIMAMPMTYNSLVGDMGSSLSGGQKQRVLLARALYRDPRILFLDEGTAHLDVANERLVNESLRQLQITRVSIAHRPDIVSGADRVVRIARTIVDDGRTPIAHGISADPRQVPVPT